MACKVEVDMVLDKSEMRNSMGNLSVQGETRKAIEAAGLRSVIVREVGPSGWPEVRLIGSRSNLVKYLREVYMDDGANEANIVPYPKQ